MLTLKYRNAIKKDIEKQKKRGKDLLKLSLVIHQLANNIPLDKKLKNHKLVGDYIGHWECHIEPDWLLIYRKTQTELILERTGTHSDLFK